MMLSFNPSFSDLEIYTSSDVHSTQNYNNYYNDPTPAIIEVENISSQTKANPTELVSSVEVIEGELQSLVSSIRKLSKKIFNSLQENVSKLIQMPNATHQMGDRSKLFTSIEAIEGELQSLVSSIRKLSKKIFNSLQENVSKLIQTPNTTHQSEHLIRDCSKLSSSIRQQNEEMERGFFSIDLND